MGQTAITDPVQTLDARHLAHHIAHALYIHGILKTSPRDALSGENLPALAVELDGRKFLVNVEELS
jgi:hypothetical protein